MTNHFENIACHFLAVNDHRILQSLLTMSFPTPIAMKAAFLQRHISVNPLCPSYLGEEHLNLTVT